MTIDYTKTVQYNGREVNYQAAVALMDDELREQLHSDLAPCTEQEYFDAYVAAHAGTFGRAFAIA